MTKGNNEYRGDNSMRWEEEVDNATQKGKSKSQHIK